MFFPNLLPSDSDRQRLEKVCEDFSAFFQDCSACLVEAYNAAQQAAAKTQEAYHVPILLLVRHVIESLDGVSILVSKGGSHPCQPLLRSALEAVLGLMYILEADTKRRALAYQVAHAHKKIKLYERLDPTTKAGQELRNLLEDDPCKTILNSLPIINYPKLIANLQAMLANPEFQPLEQEWQALKRRRNNKDPEWFGLFGGPGSVRDLAVKVKWPGMYEFLYRMWSNEVHAGSALEAIGRKGGATVIRPIRHPEMLQPAVQHATNLALLLSLKLLEAYAPEKIEEFKKQYVERIRQRAVELLSKQVVVAPWKDTTL